MSRLHLINARLKAGVWRAVVLSEVKLDHPPSLAVMHEGNVQSAVVVEVGPDGAGQQWLLTFAVPSECLSDGTQLFIVSDTVRDEAIGQFTIQCGPTTEGELAADVELLRAELDLLKRAFRRHCTNTAG